MALIDSGAEGMIVHQRFADKHHLIKKKLERPFPVRNVDGTENTMGLVTHTTIQRIHIYDHETNAYHEEDESE